MIIAQITDLHIGFHGPEMGCENTKRLESVLAELSTQTRQPDLLLVTGDLVETGANWAYEKLKNTLDDVKFPYYLTIGNHDDREAFSKIFSDENFTDGFLQYTIENWPLRIIVLDTLEPGRHGGAFCKTRAKWLKAELDKAPQRPTLIALHHPPIETGIGWMTASDDDEWVIRLHDVISKYDNIVHIISGHIHRSIFKRFAGTNLSVARAVAPQVALDLAKIDIDTPDNRIMLVDAKAGYSLHEWDGKALTIHNGIAQDGRPILRYDDKHAFIVRLTKDLPPA